MSEPAKKERKGWGHPTQARKWHYFDGDAISLCRRWMFTGDLDDVDGTEVGPHDCVPCRREFNQIQQKAKEASERASAET